MNHQTFERTLRSGVFIRACLFQWRLPLSPAGHLGGRAPLRAARAAGFERVTAPRGCVAPGAEATDSLYRWVYSKHLHQQSSVVVGFALPIADSSGRVALCSVMSLPPSEEGVCVRVLVCAALWAWHGSAFGRAVPDTQYVVISP